MAFDFNIFGQGQLNEEFVDWLIAEQWPDNQSHYNRLWDYYQNPSIDSMSERRCETARPYIQAQEIGLPARITGMIYSRCGGLDAGRQHNQIQRKEVVIENDIAWRINAMVDFLFGKQIRLVSLAPDPDRRSEIERILDVVFEANGGQGFYQDMAVLGSVYGFTDCLVRPGHAFDTSSAGTVPVISDSHDFSAFQQILRYAATISLELIEAPRTLPVLDENDYRNIRFYIQHFYLPRNEVVGDGHVMRQLGGRSLPVRRKTSAVTEIISPDAWQRYEDFELVFQQPNPLGFAPVVHIQNLAQPGFYEGLSDVGQLIPLQDELNTRLSDRASRLTFGAFKMYLVKGLDSAYDKPVAPGRMWFTDNPDAKIESFGGDQPTPGENLHIAEIREAMDKISGVTPVVAGVLKNKLGNLTSGVALKMTCMGMLTKTTRKQFTYGQGIRRIGRMILQILDKTGVYRTTPEERRLDVLFPNPLPEDSAQSV